MSTTSGTVGDGDDEDIDTVRKDEEFPAAAKAGDDDEDDSRETLECWFDEIVMLAAKRWLFDSFMFGVCVSVFVCLLFYIIDIAPASRFCCLLLLCWLLLFLLPISLILA